jgi:uncharacterized membrane protein
MVTLSKTRIEALSDGVFSIAMTLLVLKLEVPEYHHSNDEMLRQLLALQPRMFVSLLPFSAGLMGHLLMHPVSQVFYFGNQLTIALLLNLHWQYALRKGFTVDAADAGRQSFRVAHAAAISRGA